MDAAAFFRKNKNLHHTALEITNGRDVIANVVFDDIERKIE